MFSRKRIFVVTGFESSGSVFAAKTVSHVVGKCASFGDWNGYGWNGKLGDKVVVAHRSLPFMRPRKWLDDLNEEIARFSNYDKRFILCTRDISISEISRRRRFGGTKEEYQQDTSRTKDALGQLLAEQDCFIFSFESAVALKEHYYRHFYAWLGVKSDFSPPIFDANAPYIFGQASAARRQEE